MVGQLTIGIPGAGAADYVTTPIPSLVLFRQPTDAPLALRSELGYAEVTGRSNYGTPQVSGPNYDPTYQWAVAAMLTEAEARQLGALAKWRDRQYKSNANGRLRLIDQVEYLDSEASPHSRTLLATLTETWNAGYSYGYGVFDVKIQLPPDWRSQAGLWASGSQARLCTFSLIEV